MKEILIISDLDDTITRTNNENNGIVPDEFYWAPNFRGDSFFDELKRRHPKNWHEIFFKLYDQTNIDRKVLNELTLNLQKNKFKDFRILTAGIRNIQMEKIHNLELLGKVAGISTVAKSAEKTNSIIEIVNNLGYKNIEKIIIAEDRPHNINKKVIEIITQIPVELIKVELASNGPNLTIMK